MYKLVCFALLVAATWHHDPRAAQAHFLWLVLEPAEQPTTAKVYFGNAPIPDDPELLGSVASAQVWSVGKPGTEPQAIEFRQAGDALEAELPAKLRSNPCVLRHTYGVASRGDETFLLNYYAKAYPSQLPDSWTAIDDSQRLPLEILPRREGSQLAVEVLWHGKPAADATVTVDGPGMKKSLEGQTDAQGVYRFPIGASGVYAIRAGLIESTAGERGGKAYDSIRHYSTLALPLSAAHVTPAAHSWPELPQGITSFGGAVVDDKLYVYGGNYGRAHHVSQEGQSGDLYRLDLEHPQQWEQLASDTKLTGLSMVGYGGKLYRVGGFTAKNEKESDDQDLWSQAEFKCFDPAKGAWESRTPLPEGRSSHDAAVLGSKIYVVGGWQLRGGADAQWHDTAWSIDLAQDNPQWQPIAQPPFQRRAVSLAAWQGKLYLMGGMQPDDTTTTAVAVYDPATDTWSEGPNLIGKDMDGFGTSSFACDGGLYVTTMSGTVERLADDGKSWEAVGALEHPRFFHRLLPWKNRDLVVVGGASMKTGKALALERLPAAAGHGN